MNPKPIVSFRIVGWTDGMFTVDYCDLMNRGGRGHPCSAMTLEELAKYIDKETGDLHWCGHLRDAQEAQGEE